MNTRKKRIFQIIRESIGIIVGLLFLSPALLIIINAFKPLSDILKTPFALPKELYIDNVTYVIENMKYFKALSNTLIIAVIVVSVTAMLSSMAGYKLSRHGGKMSAIITMLFLSSLLIPFQSIMIPIAKITSMLGIGNSMTGYIITIIPLYAPMGIFMCMGFVKTIPMSLEEAAIIDGCSPHSVFFRVVLPLLKPTIASLVVLFSLWIWNDFALANMMLKTESNRTLTVAIYGFFSSFQNRWDYALTALALSVIPIVIFYIFMQRFIVKGVSAGAIKG